MSIHSSIHRSKLQKHNNVHVEIFLGGETGEETIGARFTTGKVSIFPSYKFVSSKWSLVNYHFRSLDTWLEGKCDSCCPDHPWQTGALMPSGSKSIFYSNSDDESAGDADSDKDFLGEEDADTELASNTISDGTLMKISLPISSLDLNLNPDGQICATKINISSVDAQSTQQTSSQGRTSFNAHVESSKMMKKTDCDTRLTGSFDSTTQISSSSRRRHLMEQRSSSINAKSHSAIKDKMPPPNSYYVGKSNGWKLVKTALDNRGWQQLPFEYGFSTRYSLKWVERRSQIDYRSHIAGQVSKSEFRYYLSFLS